MLNNQKGVISQIIILLVLLAGLAALFYLVQKQQIFKSKATPGVTVEIVDDNGSPVTTTTSSTVKVKLSEPTWSSP